MFRAVQVDRQDKSDTTVSVIELDESALPDGDVTVDVSWSTLNYKDGLVLKGLGGLVKTYPHVPGVDFAGTVRESRDDRYAPGDGVILTGWRVGELHWGGYAERARVKGDWLVPLPDGLDAREAMSIGTAGFSAMLAVMALEEAGPHARRRAGPRHRCLGRRRFGRLRAARQRWLRRRGFDRARVLARLPRLPRGRYCIVAGGDREAQRAPAQR